MATGFAPKIRVALTQNNNHERSSGRGAQPRLLSLLRGALETRPEDCPGAPRVRVRIILRRKTLQFNR